jgi:hypothetical protein
MSPFLVLSVALTSEEMQCVMFDARAGIPEINLGITDQYKPV